MVERKRGGKKEGERESLPSQETLKERRPKTSTLTGEAHYGLTGPNKL